MLRAEGIAKRFGGVVAVSDFDMSVGEKQIVGIIGPNGAGKTTVLNLISGLYKVDAGTITFGDTAITGLAPWQIGRLGIARTFQNIRLFEGLKVLDNVKAARSWKGGYGFLRALFQDTGVRRSERAIAAAAAEALETVGIGHLADELAGNLSYGQQRRVELARALASEPRLLLLDEPAAGLNPQEVQDLIALIARLRQDLGLSIVIIEHRMEVIMELCDCIYVQDFGRLIAQGTPAEIRQNPVVIKAYLGEEFE